MAAVEQAAVAPDALWYKDVVIYQTHVKAYYDGNDDGSGDFRGLTEKLDYVRDLGVDAIWLLPFYPSPLRDDGYDIADYRAVHPAYGTLDDFRRFLDEAHRRGLRVITELVINHTSDQHEWFQRARRAPRGSPERDFYVWSDDPRKYPDARIIFTDTEKSNWTWDEVAGQYFWHRFFSHQPDLNFENPAVIDAVVDTMRWWLDMGVDGLRLDAIPYLIERDGTNCENLPETHSILKRLRAELDVRHADRMFLAEANQWPEDVRAYFADGDECHMAYHFPLMPRMYMAIAQEDRHPIIDIMNQTPEIPEACQWAIFLRNHDELTLEMVTGEERDYMYRQYAADPRARINLGIRRRLAPLMENDVARIRLMNGLLLSMPGSPIVYYGDELGMGDNIYLGDRNGVRTPMQWSPDRNGGFSRADPQRLYFPPIMDPVYGYEAVNVESQLREPSSLLNWTRRMLAVRKTSRAFGRGRLKFIRPGNRKILAYLREYDDDAILCVANLARTAQPVELDLRAYAGRVPVEMLGRTAFPPIGQLPYMLTLPGHHFYWFKLERNVPAPAWHVELLGPDELPMLVLFEGWVSVDPESVAPWRRALAEAVRRQLESALYAFVATQRWYAAKGSEAIAARLDRALPWAEGGGEWLLAFVAVERAEASTTHWFVPLSLVWDDAAGERANALRGCALARARRHARVGFVADAMQDGRFVHAIVASIAAGAAVDSPVGRLRFEPTAAFAELAGEDYGALTARVLGADSSNTSVALGERLLFKAIRRVQPGLNPEVEIGAYLTDVVPFRSVSRVAGALYLDAPDGSVYTLGVLQEFVLNQGDGWRFAREYLEHYLERQGNVAGPHLPEDHGGFLQMIAVLGRRTAELHVALAGRHGRPEFDPEPVTREMLAEWARRIEADLHETLRQLAAQRGRLPAEAEPLAERVLDAGPALAARVRECATADPMGLCRTRHHGDYHLGQVLVAKNDFVIVDFEGEPQRSIEERRAKHSPLRDVAGMLRSFDYVRHAATAQVGSLQPSAALAGLGFEWSRAASETFVAAYRAVAEHSCVMGEWREASRLIELFVLEKALYEVRYELDNRPDWVSVPLYGLTRLADGDGTA
jgi:maltose alpha-D-glucosyltransferase/alpha-amylase